MGVVVEEEEEGKGDERRLTRFIIDFSVGVEGEGEGSERMESVEGRRCS